MEPITISRKNAYQMNPKDITVNPQENPRNHYGTEDFEALKQSILENGLQYPVSVSEERKDGKVVKVKVTHGFRRMRAIRELLKEGHNIPTIPVNKSKGDRVTVLVEHMVLNGGKELTPLEKSSIVVELREKGLTYDEIGKRTGLGQQMAYNLSQFALKASEKLIAAVENGTVTMTTASEIVRKSDSKSEQDVVLEKGLTKAQSSGRSTVRNTDVPTSKASISKKQFLTLVAELDTAKDVIDAVLDQCNWTRFTEEAE